MVTVYHRLLQLHIEAVWGVRLPSLREDHVELLPESFQPHWKLCVAQLVNERVHVWRPDVPASERKMLLSQVEEALAFFSPIPFHLRIEREIAFSLANVPRLDKETVQRMARPLTLQDRALIADFQPDSLSYYLHPDKNPLVGIVVDERLLSIAHSSRRTLHACELGIDTLPEARRKGFALAATIMWTNLILEENLVHIYSADASNTASLGLAVHAGCQAFARIALFSGK